MIERNHFVQTNLHKHTLLRFVVYLLLKQPIVQEDAAQSGYSVSIDEKFLSWVCISIANYKIELLADLVVRWHFAEKNFPGVI